MKMFKVADGDSSWLRVPVITYLRACPKPEAATYIEELRKIDPQAVERADFFLGFGEDDDDWGDEEEEDDWDDKDSAGDKEKGEAGDGGSQKPVSQPPNKEGGGSSAKSASDLQGETNAATKLPTDAEQMTFVSTAADPVAVAAASPQVAQNLPPSAPPLAVADQPGRMTLSILLVPFAGSMLVFLLMWSVVHGWFERLIY